MIGTAGCRGAATIVNAIPTGRGAAFGITLEANASVELSESEPALKVMDVDEGDDLVVRCVRATLERAKVPQRGGRVRVVSDIPVSRGLKSSSAVSSAVVLATSRAASAGLDDSELMDIAVTQSIEAGVTITGAYDDEAACFLGGVVVTDNPSRRILAAGRMDPSLKVIIHVPDRKIRKSSVRNLDFTPAVPQIEEAIRLALAGEYTRAMELNSSACSKILDISEGPAELARDNGAVAAGVSGTGPATVALVRPEDTERLVQAMESLDGELIRAHINDTPSKEVVPRLL